MEEQSNDSFRPNIILDGGNFSFIAYENGDVTLYWDSSTICYNGRFTVINKLPYLNVYNTGQSEANNVKISYKFNGPEDAIIRYYENNYPELIGKFVFLRSFGENSTSVHYLNHNNPSVRELLSSSRMILPGRVDRFFLPYSIEKSKYRLYMPSIIHELVALNISHNVIARPPKKQMLTDLHKIPPINIMINYSDQQNCRYRKVFQLTFEFDGYKEIDYPLKGYISIIMKDKKV